MPTEKRKPWVVLFGDSTLDNKYWTARGENIFNIEDAVEGQLRKELGEDYEVVCLANDGFTTKDMLEGADRDKAVLAYDDEFYEPFKALEEQIKAHGGEKPDHLVLSVGGNDFREELELLPLLPVGVREIYLNDVLGKITQRYLTILDKCESMGIKPIIQMQYTPNAGGEDIYHIYELMRGMSTGTGLTTILSTAIQNHLRGYSHVSTGDIDYVHGMMQVVYQRIFNVANERGLAMIDMSSSMDYRDPTLNESQIEPSANGSTLIAGLLKKVFMDRDQLKRKDAPIEQQARMYSCATKSRRLEIRPYGKQSAQQWRPAQSTARIRLRDAKYFIFDHLVKNPRVLMLESWKKQHDRAKWNKIKNAQTFADLFNLAETDADIRIAMEQRGWINPYTGQLTPELNLEAMQSLDDLNERIDLMTDMKDFNEFMTNIQIVSAMMNNHQEKFLPKNRSNSQANMSFYIFQTHFKQTMMNYLDIDFGEYLADEVNDSTSFANTLNEVSNILMMSADLEIQLDSLQQYLESRDYLTKGESKVILAMANRLTDSYYKELGTDVSPFCKEKLDIIDQIANQKTTQLPQQTSERKDSWCKDLMLQFKKLAKRIESEITGDKVDADRKKGMN